LKARHLHITIVIGWPFESRVLSLYITVATGGPLESRVLTHCSCWPLWKQSTYTLQLLLGLPFESRVVTHCSCYWGPFESWVPVLYTTVAVGSPFESWVPAHYSCCWGPLWKQCRLLTHYCCCRGPLWKQGAPLAYFFTKSEENLRAKHVEEVICSLHFLHHVLCLLVFLTVGIW